MNYSLKLKAESLKDELIEQRRTDIENEFDKCLEWRL